MRRSDGKRGGHKRRAVCVPVLHGEPLDGSGRVCIHLFVQDATGPFTEGHALLPIYENGEQVKQKATAGPARGRLACNPKRLVAPVESGGVVTVTPRSDDPRAVSCPRCMATDEYRVAMVRIAAAR